MAQLFNVKVNDAYSFKMAEAELDKIQVLDATSNQFHVLTNDHPIEVTVCEADFRSRIYHIQIKNEVFKVEIENALDQQISDMGFSTSSAKNIEAILAPMPGLIHDILVTQGESVLEDSPLLVLEAMKMENVITSPRAGIIKEINIQKGDAVDKKQILISYE